MPQSSTRCRPSCPLCGPKLSAFCMIMSVWGILFLGILGVFFYFNAVSLFPDLHMDDEKSVDDNSILTTYSEKAKQCWIAAGLYVITLVAVIWQNKWNSQSVL